MFGSVLKKPYIWTVLKLYVFPFLNFNSYWIVFGKKRFNEKCGEPFVILNMARLLPISCCFPITSDSNCMDSKCFHRHLIENIRFPYLFLAYLYTYMEVRHKEMKIVNKQLVSIASIFRRVFGLNFGVAGKKLIKWPNHASNQRWWECEIQRHKQRFLHFVEE